MPDCQASDQSGTVMRKNLSNTNINRRSPAYVQSSTGLKSWMLRAHAGVTSSMPMLFGLNRTVRSKQILCEQFYSKTDGDQQQHSQRLIPAGYVQRSQQLIDDLSLHDSCLISGHRLLNFNQLIVKRYLRADSANFR